MTAHQLMTKMIIMWGNINDINTIITINNIPSWHKADSE